LIHPLPVRYIQALLLEFLPKIGVEIFFASRLGGPENPKIPNFLLDQDLFHTKLSLLGAKKCYKPKTVSRLGLNDTTLISWWFVTNPFAKYVCSSNWIMDHSPPKKKIG